MKKEWIYNFPNILTNHKDLSDYERYFISFKKYIKDNKEEHFDISKVLLKGILKFKKTFLLSIAYRLICILNIKIQINEKVILKHFKKKSLRSVLFPVFTLTNTQLKKSKILKMLYDENYEDKYFFEYLVDKKEVLTDFLTIVNKKLIRKQLLVILHTKFYYNMKYFIKFLGDKNKYLGFLTYEIITQIVLEENNFTEFEIIRKNKIFDFKDKIFDLKDNIVDLKNKIVNLKDNIEVNRKNKIVDLKNKIVNFKNKIEVNSIDNFLIYFLPFMQNKILIYELIKENRYEEIEHILKNKYVITNSKLKEIRNLNFYSLEIKNNRNLFNDFLFDHVEEDYAFLFSGVNYKSISDCIEF